MKKYRIGKFEFDAYTLLLVALTVAAFVIRVWDVGYLTLWVDEYVHVNRARFFPEQPLFATDNNGILLTMFIVPLFKLFGVSEFWARFPSVVFGTLLVPAAYLFAKRFFNRNIAVTTATLVTFSTYLAYWSRLSRNYAIFAFFFILFLYFLGRALNVDDSFRAGKSRVLNYLRLQPKLLWVALALLVLSVMSHQLTFLFIYGLMFYYVLLFVRSICLRQADFKGIEAVVTYLFAVFSFIVFVPSVQGVFKSFFLLFLPENVANWVLPNLGRLSELMKTQPYSAFQVYNGVLRTDYAWLYIPGLIGFVCMLARFRKSAFYVVSMFGVLFLAMSFVFREPSLPRYLIYIYPLFLMAVACSFDTLFVLLGKAKLRVKPAVATAVTLAAILCTPTVRATVKMVSAHEHGQVVPTTLSAFYFPDWKTSLGKVKPLLGEHDVLISTMPNYVSFYTGRTSYWFRQRHYNSTTHRYENLEVDLTKPNAHSTEALAKLLDESGKAWLLVDYYFDNVMTDPETRNYVIRNMQFEYAMSDDYVSVFSWDKSKHRENADNAIFEFLRPSHPQSGEYSINLPAPTDMNVYLDLEGIAYDNQAVLYVNGYVLGVGKRQGSLSSQGGDSRSRQLYRVQVPAKAFKQGRNSIAFILNQPKDGRKVKNNRFVVYNMHFEPIAR